MNLCASPGLQQAQRSRPEAEQAVVIATLCSAGMTVLGTGCLQHGQENSSHLQGEKQRVARACGGS